MTNSFNRSKRSRICHREPNMPASSTTATAVFTICKKLTGASAGFVGMPSTDGTRIEILFLESGGISCKVDPNRLKLMKGIWKEVYDTASARYTNSLPDSGFADFLPEGHIHIENVLVTPLTVEGKRVGLLGLANKPGGFTEADVRVVSELADITAMELWQGGGREGKEGLNTRLETSPESAAFKVALKLAKSPSRKEYLDIVVEMVRNWSGCHCVGIRMLDDLGNMPYESYVGFSREFWEWENWLSAKNDVCVCTRIITDKTETQDSAITTPSGSFRCDNMHSFLSDLPRDKRKRFRGMCPKYGYLSLAFVPIRYRDKVIGGIHIADEEEGKVPPKMVEFIESITPLIGEGVQKFSLEDELHARLHQQIQLADFGKRALTGEDLSELMNVIIVMVTKTLKADYGAVLELLPGGKELLFRAGVGWKQELAGKVINAGADSLEGYTLLAGKPVIVTELPKEDRFGGSQLLLDNKVVSGISIVIPGAEQPFGILGVYTPLWRKFMEYDINFLLSIVNILAETIGRKKAEDALGRQAQIIDQIHDAVVSTDLDGYITSWNKGAERLYGFAASEILGRHIAFLYPEEEHDFLRHQVIAPLIEKGRNEVEVRLRRPSGAEYFIHLSLSLLKGSNNVVIGMIWASVDITERKRYETQLERQANYDTLTALPNRTLLRDRLTHAMAYARRRGRTVAMLFVGLDDFKFVNDSLGHDKGDLLLQKVAQRLLTCVREGDTVARQGGDEFVLVLEDVRGDDEVSIIAERTLAAMAQPFQIGEHELFLTCSIGITLCPRDGEDALNLLRNADIAMYRAKERGGNTLQFFSAAMNSKALERLKLEKSLRLAVARAELLLHYQPRVSLATGRIVGLEALVRWQHPEMGLISPAKFIPLAEETGLIEEIGEWVLRTACAQNKAWQDNGLMQVGVAVNLSPRQFKRQDLVAQVAAVLKETGFDPRYLELEITENLLMQDVETAISTLTRLKAIGVKISIDDFGTGYSSLSYLKRFPIDTLKIDQSFIRDITADPDDATIAKTIISMAHGMRLKVVAEGVETDEQMSFLHAHDCDEIQGYYFSRPVPAAEFVQLLFRAGLDSR